LTSVPELIQQLDDVRQREQAWREYLEQVDESNKRNELHLAVFTEPYLRFILEGCKTVESRFSMRPCPPCGEVRDGDFVLLKRSAGPIVGVCRVADVWFYRLDPESWSTIMEDFGEALCASDSQFWQERKSARFATLMRIEAVQVMPPAHLQKRDRRAWVILRPTNRLQDTLWTYPPESL